MTFSRLRAWWRPAGWAALPFTWLINLALIGVHAGDIVQWQAAAAQVPNPVARPGRRLWAAVLLPLGLFPVMLVFLQHTQTSAGVYHAAAAVLCVCAGATLVELVVSVRIQHGAGRLKKTERMIREKVTGPIVTGSLFGAWPRGTGAGRQLLDAGLAELARDGVTLLVLARDQHTADWYVDEHHGARINPEYPLHIAWLNS